MMRVRIELAVIGALILWSGVLTAFAGLPYDTLDWTRFEKAMVYYSPPTSTPSRTPAAGTATPTPAPGSLSWTTKASMPTPRECPAVAVAGNGKLYAIGGGDRTVALATVEEYDPATDTWRSRAPLPTARSVCGGEAAAANGKIYLLGGYGTSAVAAVDEYDPATDTWASRTPMPEARYGHAVAIATNGKIYVIGGCSNSACQLSTVDEYDPATDTWATKASMPGGRNTLAAVGAPNGKVYASGGYIVNATDSLYEYDPATDTWATKASMPIARASHGLAAASNGKVYVVGGLNNSVRPILPVDEYDPATDTWTSKANLPTGRWNLGVAGSGLTLYAVGGWDDAALLGTVEAATIVSDLAGTATSTVTATASATAAVGWQAGPALPGPRAGFNNAVAAGSYAYVVGGASASSVLTTVVRAPIDAGGMLGAWETLGSGLNNGRCCLAVASYNGYLYAVAGAPASGSYYSSVERAQINGDGTMGPFVYDTSLPNALIGHAAVAANGYLYVIGGYEQPGAHTAAVHFAAINPDGSLGAWQSTSSLTVARNGVGAVVAAGYLYAMGGDSGGASYTSVERAAINGDGTLGAWSVVGQMNESRNGAAVIGAGRLYVAGGSVNPGGMRASVESAPINGDGTLGAFRLEAALSEPRAPSLIATQSRLYAIGGSGSGGYTDMVEALVIATPTAIGTATATSTPTRTSTAPATTPNPTATSTPTAAGEPRLSWATKAPLGTVRYSLAAAAVGDQVYAIGGGYSAGTHLGTTEEYNPATNTWATRATMPTGRTGVALAVTDRGTILAIGGYNLSWLATVEEYDPMANTWTTRPSMPGGGRWILGAARSGNKVYAIGGADSSQTVATVEEFDLPTNTWASQSRASMPAARSEMGVVAGCDGKIYAIGGGTATSPAVSTVEAYDPAADTWASRASMPTARTGLAAALGWNCKIYAVGGRTSNDAGAELATVEEYDPTADTWATVERMPTARFALGAAVPSNGKIYAVGGDVAGTALATVEEATIVGAPGPTATATPVRTPTPTPTAAGPAPAGPAPVRVSNVTDVAFRLSWVTPFTSTARVAVVPAGGGAPIEAADTRGAGFVDDTHYVRVTGLLPATTYSVTVYSAGMTPMAVLTVSTGPTIDAIPPVDTLGGFLYLPDQATLATGAIVYLAVEDADGQGSPGVSALLSALVNDSGAWQVDLPPRRTGLQEYFAYGNADRFRLVADGGQRGATARVLSVGGPRLLSGLSLARPAAVGLQPGWTLVALPNAEVGPYTADSLLQELATQGIRATQLVRWHNGAWDSYLSGFPFNDFALEPGRGYFIRTAAGGTWVPRPRAP